MVRVIDVANYSAIHRKDSPLHLPSKEYPAPNVRVSLRTPALASAVGGIPSPPLRFSYLLPPVIHLELHTVSRLCLFFCAFLCLEFCEGHPPNLNDIYVFSNYYMLKTFESREGFSHLFAFLVLHMQYLILQAIIKLLNE